MTDPNLTALGLVLDRSGSMLGIRSDAEGALSQFLEEQRKIPGEVLFTYVRFNESPELIHLNVPLNTVESIELQPMGMTALLDAIGLTITKMGTAFATMQEQERPSKVLLAIVTDGLENASKEYTRQQVFDMITAQREQWNWEVIFLAANQDAIAAGAQLGVPINSSMTFDATPEGTVAMASAASTYAATYRVTGKGSFEPENSNSSAAK